MLLRGMNSERGKKQRTRRAGEKSVCKNALTPDGARLTDSKVPVGCAGAHGVTDVTDVTVAHGVTDVTDVTVVRYVRYIRG